MANLTTIEVKDRLDILFRKQLGNQYSKLEFLSQSTSVVDGISVFKLYNNANKLYAVVLCSPSSSPNLVMRTMHRSQLVRASLNASTSKHIIEPAFEGKIDELTYAVLPYCYELSKFRPYRKIQSIFLKPVIFDWLFNVTKTSVKEVDQSSANSDFAAPLQHLAALKCLNEQIRTKSSFAIERLSTKAWKPKHVVMHGDLWVGNILLRADANILNTIKPHDNFVITDWAGSEVNGYAIYDLIRLAESMNLSPKKLNVEVNKHCDLLECDFIDATSYLLAALGFIAMNLEHFPLNRFVSMAESCFSTLSKASD